MYATVSIWVFMFMMLAFHSSIFCSYYTFSVLHFQILLKLFVAVAGRNELLFVFNEKYNHLCDCSNDC